MKRLGPENIEDVYTIAKIHEEISTYWIDNYQTSEEFLQTTYTDLKDRLYSYTNFLSVIQIDQRVISYIWAEVNEHDWKQIDIISLWTDKEFRGQGLAKQLKVGLEIWAKKEMHATKIYTTVSSRNKNMIQLNESLGYETRYYRMIKELK